MILSLFNDSRQKTQLLNYLRSNLKLRAMGVSDFQARFRFVNHEGKENGDIVNDPINVDRDKAVLNFA